MGVRFLPSGFARRFRTDLRTLSCRRIRGGPTLSERALALDRIAGTLVVFCALLWAAWLAARILPPAALTVPAVAETAQADTAAANRTLQALGPGIAATRLGEAEVRAIQTRLRSLGFDPGAIDGIAGPRTLGALNQYRASRNLGRVSWIDRANVAGLLN